MNREDHSGERFGRLTARNYAGAGRWFCVCDCGARCSVLTAHLTAGHTRSCGCLQRELARQFHEDRHAAFVSIETKRCSKCGERKPRSGFSPTRSRRNRRSSLRSWCKQCGAAESIRWAKANRDRTRLSGRLFYARHTEKVKAWAREYAKTPAGKASSRKRRLSPHRKMWEREWRKTPSGMEWTTRQNHGLRKHHWIEIVKLYQLLDQQRKEKQNGRRHVERHRNKGAERQP